MVRKSATQWVGKCVSLFARLVLISFLENTLILNKYAYNITNVLPSFFLWNIPLTGSSSEIYCILKKRFLDEMVKDSRNISLSKLDALRKTVTSNLNLMTKIFEKEDFLLKRSAAPQVYYAFCRDIHLKYGHAQIKSKIHVFLDKFQRMRTENLQNPEEERRDPILINFDRMMSQNNDKDSMQKRVGIMTRHFLEG